MTVSSCLYNIYECVSIYSCFLSKHRLQKYKYFKLEHFLQGQTPPPAHTTESKILNLIKATRQSMTSWKPNKTKIRFDISSFFLFQILVKWAVKFQSRWGFFFFWNSFVKFTGNSLHRNKIYSLSLPKMTLIHLEFTSCMFPYAESPS